MAGGGRARAEQYAERVNAAVELLGLPVAEADLTKMLVENPRRFFCGT